MTSPKGTSLKRVEFLLLLALADGPLHGYALVGRIEAESEGRLRLLPGNLYTILRRLAKQGLLGETDARPAPELDDSRRRYYALTATGRQALIDEAQRMARWVDAVRARRLLDGPQQERELAL